MDKESLLKTMTAIEAAIGEKTCAAVAFQKEGLVVARVTPLKKSECYELLAVLVNVMTQDYDVSKTEVLSEINYLLERRT